MGLSSLVLSSYGGLFCCPYGSTSGGPSGVLSGCPSGAPPGVPSGSAAGGTLALLYCILQGVKYIYNGV